MIPRLAFIIATPITLCALWFTGFGVAQEPPEPQFNCDFISSGTSGNNSFQGTDYNDCWSGLGGNDVAAGFNGNDRLDMGSGDDQVCGGNCSGTGIDRQDVLRGDTGQDLLIGDAGPDFLYLGGGNGNEGRGGDGNDTIAACNNNPDLVRGQAGFNTAYLDRAVDTWSNIDEKHFC